VTIVAISAATRMGMRAYRRDGVDVVETPDLFWGSARSGWDPWDVWARLRFVARGDWDLVHAFDSRPAVIAPALALRRRGVPLVIDWADWWGRGGTIEVRRAGSALKPLVRVVETYFEEAFRTRADATTVISSPLLERAAQLGVPRETIAHLPQGADIDKITPRPMATCRQQLGLPGGTLVVGYLGVLSRSDAALLFGAFAALRRRQADARLLLIGKPTAAVPSLDGIVETGFVADDRLPVYLGACDLMLLPLKDTVSSRGRWPSKISDYLSAGRPVVASAVGDVRRLFAKHQIGATAEDNPDAMADACLELWRDRDRCTACGRVGRHVAETELAWPTLTAHLEDHYRSALRRCSDRIRVGADVILD
jgi:glycosyltransferase involved in cell wall biosynthesis